MKALGIVLFLASGASYGEVPESIVGVWRFDMVRTMSEHIDRLAKLRADVVTPEVAETQKAALQGLPSQIDFLPNMTITENTITNETAPGFNATYRVIGGNSRLVIIDGKNDAGFAWVGHIRLVEGGIALETTDCETYPEQCAYGRRRAITQNGVVADANTIAAVTDGGEASTELYISGGTQVDGPSSTEIFHPPSQPKWLYFTRAEN